MESKINITLTDFEPIPVCSRIALTSGIPNINHLITRSLITRHKG